MTKRKSYSAEQTVKNLRGVLCVSAVLNRVAISEINNELGNVPDEVLSIFQQAQFYVEAQIEELHDPAIYLESAVKDIEI